MTSHIKAATALALGLGLVGVATAQTAGTLLVRAGITQIRPDVTSGDLTAPSFVGTKADIESSTKPTAGLTYMVSDSFSLDLPLALGFRHDIVGDGAIAGVGKIGEVKALPITLLAQYRFGRPGSFVRPYLGIGPTYAKFYKARSTAVLTGLTGGTPTTPTTLSVESKWTASFQAGVSWMVTPSIFVDATVLKTPLKTRTTLSTGQTLDAKLDPMSVQLAVGWKF